MILDCELPPNWIRTTIDDIKLPVKGSLVSGPFGSNIGKKYFVETGIPVIRGNNLKIGENKFIDEGFVFITEEKAYELRNCTAVSQDIIFTAAGTLGQVGIIPAKSKFSKYIVSNKQLRLRCNTEFVEPMYVYYWFSNSEIRDYVANHNTGSSVPLITLGTLRSLLINLPPLPTQKKIVAILSAYDDLIENNNRRIKILEEMAQNLYREWFVNFRYPGHENVPLVESELGMIPEGWEVVKLGDKLHREKKTKEFRSDELNDIGTTPVIDQSEKSILGFHEFDPDFDVSSDRPLIVFGDHTRKIQVVNFPFSLGPNTLAISFFPSILNYWGFYALKDLELSAEYKRHWNDLSSKFIIFPKPEIAQKFSIFINNNYAMISKLGFINRNLRQQRDLLLPRLIGGELDVSSIEIGVN